MLERVWRRGNLLTLLVGMQAGTTTTESSVESPCVCVCVCVCVKSLSHVRLFATPWTVACQAPLSMRFSSKNTGVDCHFLLQGIFPTQGSNLGPLHCRQTLYPLSHQGSLFLRRFLKKLEIELPYDPAITQRKPKLKENMYPNVHCSTVYNS